MIVDIDLSKTVLFKGFFQEDIVRALTCLEAKLIKLEKKEIYAPSDQHTICIILSGTLYLSSEDEMGNRHIITILKAGDILGEQSLNHTQSHNSIAYQAYVAEACQLLLINTHSIISTASLCSLRTKVIENLFNLLLMNNERLYAKLQIFTFRSLRHRLLHYFQIQVELHGQSTFKIPLSRTELADYLNVDRSSLSREMSNMKKDKLIFYERDEITLL